MNHSRRDRGGKGDGVSSRRRKHCTKDEKGKNGNI